MIQESFMRMFMQRSIKRFAPIFAKPVITIGPAQSLAQALILTLSSILFLGCIGTNPVSPTRFYLLPQAAYEAPLNTGTDKRGKAVIEIQALRLPQYLEKPQIVTRSAGNRLELAEYDQWGGNLRKNMIRVMRQNLTFLLATPHVAQAPFASPSSSGYRITAEVMAFEADASGFVSLKVHWRLSDRASGRLITARVSQFDRKVENPGSKKPGAEKTGAESPGMDRIVDAMGAAMGDFCLEVGRAVQADMNGEG